MLVQDVMRRDVLTVRDSQSLLDALLEMVKRGVRHAPVLQEGRLVGVLSERDVLRHRAKWAHDGRVVEAMTREPQVTVPDASVESASAALSTHKIGCLPVVEGERLVGMVTTTDLLTALAQEPVPTRSHLRAADVMQTRVQVVHAEDRLLDAAHRMLRAGIRHLPVVDGDGRLVGILSDRDVRTAGGDRLLDRGGLREHFASTKVGQAMTRNPACVPPEQGLDAVGDLLLKQHVGALPVADTQGQVLGIISYVDLLRSTLGQR